MVTKSLRFMISEPLAIILMFSHTQLAAQSLKLDYTSIYAYALDGNIKPALKLVEVDTTLLSPKDREFKAKFEARFKFSDDQTVYPATASLIDDLVKIYKDYWRKSLLDSDSNFDMMLGKNLIVYLVQHYPPAKFLMTTTNRDTIGTYLTKFLKEWLATFNLYTTGFGRTGRLIDLLIWKTQKDTVYEFSLSKQKTLAPVTMMDGFITLGWEEYATLGRHYPGGWTTKESLFCVAKAYDLSSEKFLIGYLAHESRHFSDYKLFPNLKGANVEYRAKLTELGIATKTLYETIAFFIANANAASNNPHSRANFDVIKDMSSVLFKKEYEADTEKWKRLGTRKVHKAAVKLLKQNTKKLRRAQ